MQFDVFGACLGGGYVIEFFMKMQRKNFEYEKYFLIDKRTVRTYSNQFMNGIEKKDKFYKIGAWDVIIYHSFCVSKFPVTKLCRLQIGNYFFKN